MTNHFTTPLIVTLLFVAACDSKGRRAEVPKDAEQRTGQPVDRAEESESTTSDERIVITSESFTIRGKQHSFPFSMAELTETVGPPNRVTHLRNVLSTWDEIGIVAYQATTDGLIRSISVAFSDQDYEFSPKSTFAGTLEFGGAELTRHSTLDDLTAAGLTKDVDIPFLYVSKDGAFFAEYQDALVEFAISQ